MHYWLTDPMVGLPTYMRQVLDPALQEAAQIALKFGVTTVRDTYGPLLPLMELHDEIAHGDAIGPRMQVAVDILGWGDPREVDSAAPAAFWEFVRA